MAQIEAPKRFVNMVGLQVTAAPRVYLHNLGRHSEATGLLLRLLADTSAAEPIRAYGRALRYYAGTETLGQVKTWMLAGFDRFARVQAGFMAALGEA